MSRNRPIRTRRRIPSQEIRTLSEAIEYLYSHINLEDRHLQHRDRNDLKLERTQQLLAGLDNPHQCVKHIHVAGTKGKGSTVAMLSAALQGCGLTVGTFTSPHLISVCERIQINDIPIPTQDFVSTIRKVGHVIDQQDRDAPPHFFEILTAMAFQYFANKAIDIAVVEVGLGGRFDSTNVITPEVCAITQISLDHTDILGQTIEEIAREKAGIIKENVPVYIAPQSSESVTKVMRDRAAEVGAPVFVLDDEIDFSYRYQIEEGIGLHTCVCVTTADDEFDHVKVPLPGEHQGFNCGLALAVLDGMSNRGFSFDKTKMLAGLEHTRLPGRMEALPGDPPILLDGAHNATSMEELMKTIGAHFRLEPVIVIFGCTMDKDIEGMLKALSHGADKVIFTRAKNPRSKDPVELVEMYDELDRKLAQSADDISQALELARKSYRAGENPLVVVTGSFYLVGDARKLLIDRVKKVDAADAEVLVRRSPLQRLQTLRGSTA